MTKRIWSQEELLAEHDYAKPHVAAGMKLHGGFGEQGQYISPRTKHRWDAVLAWQHALKERNVEILDASEKLLAHGNYPTPNQQLLLLEAGIGKSFWDGLTITGIIEARGQFLVDYSPPDLQKVIEEDISETATGHLSKGLLLAHGLDEGGDPHDESSLGAHDQMWFAVRDLIFGKNAYPLPEMPPSIERPKEGSFFPDLDEPYDILFTLLTDVLMIEIRAASYFDFCIQVISSPKSFPSKVKEKQLAVEMVEHIRTDENIHVAYLQTVLSELRSWTFKGRLGQIRGAKMIDPVWQDMIEWHGRTQFEIVRKQRQELFHHQAHQAFGDKADQFLAQFEAAENLSAAAE